MNARKSVRLGITLSQCSLFIGSISIAVADQPVLSDHLNTPYAEDIAIVDKIDNRLPLKTIYPKKIQLSIRLGKELFNQRKAGTFTYKVFKDPEKLADQAGGAAVLFGLEYLGMDGPVKEGVQFMKEKTQYKFGDCSQIRLSSSKLKAESCFTRETKINLNTNYKLNSFNLEFKWAL